jgi:hypothetical protein
MTHPGKTFEKVGVKIGEGAAGAVGANAVSTAVGAIKTTCFSEAAGETVEEGLVETAPEDEIVLEAAAEDV